VKISTGAEDLGDCSTAGAGVGSRFISWVASAGAAAAFFLLGVRVRVRVAPVFLAAVFLAPVFLAVGSSLESESAMIVECENVGGVFITPSDRLGVEARKASAADPEFRDQSVDLVSQKFG